MSEPEIARRCPSCGAAIREAAFFCPQCGAGLEPKGKSTQDLAPPAVTEPLPQTSGAMSVPQATVAKDSAKQPRKVGQAALGAVGAKIQRATTLARDVEGDVIHRVQKVRKISSVVFDEAGYDPSLRFVLVAAILFVLFLVIVLLNKFIT
ncbi:MAG TPA: zinc-ribbon domain-containing protein [Pyrinomonadaceae bacterium]|jgi:hypothetical protein|nr:zinc-ribbon domain-containing protein [Pyrinomonadaceae bacterium]